MPRMSHSLVLGGTIAGMAVLAGLVLVGAGSATPWQVQQPQLPDLGPISRPAYTPPTPPPLSGWPTDIPERSSRLPMQIVSWIGAGLLVLVIVALVLALVRWLAQRRLPVPGGKPDAVDLDGYVGADEEVRQAVADAVDAALARLDAAGPPRDAVVAAWMELEAAALRVGIERDPAQTPTEFTAQLLSATLAPADAVAALRGRYHAARFSEHDVTSQDVAQARDALARIARALSHAGDGREA